MGSMEDPKVVIRDEIRMIIEPKTAMFFSSNYLFLQILNILSYRVPVTFLVFEPQRRYTWRWNCHI